LFIIYIIYLHKLIVICLLH